MGGDCDGGAILCYHSDSVANGLHVSLRYVDLETQYTFCIKTSLFLFLFESEYKLQENENGLTFIE